MTVSSAKEELSRLTYLQCLIYLQFIIAASLSIFTIIGIAVGHDVVTFLLLSLLQFLITVPGCVFNTQRSFVFLGCYVVLQGLTGICELAWFVICALGRENLAIVIGLFMLFLVQLAAVVITFFFRDVSLLGGRKEEKKIDTHLAPFTAGTHPTMTYPSSSLDSELRSQSLPRSRVTTDRSEGSSLASPLTPEQRNQLDRNKMKHLQKQLKLKRKRQRSLSDISERSKQTETAGSSVKTVDETQSTPVGPSVEEAAMMQM